MVQWLKNAVFYEIYPQSFMDSGSDGIGDFKGIISKLDYVASLGCNAIWLNPCFVSPFTDAGYDVADYYTAAPRYGTNAELRQLFDEVHGRGMHILLDLVPGHTSIEHEWFKQSMKPERNEYSGRYIWTDSIWKSIEGIKNLTGCIRGLSDRDGSCATNFYSTQPALNYGFAEPSESWQCSVDSPDAVASREAMQDVMSFWLDLGCDGFRVDMAGAMIKNDPDGSATVEFWRKVRAFLDKKHPDAVLISEWGEPEKALTAGFDMDFLLHFGSSYYNDLFRCDEPFFSRSGKGRADRFAAAYRLSVKASGGRGLICIPSGNHDMVRLSHYLDTDEMKLAFAFILSMPGAPFIYYGDEIGMRYLEGLPSKEGGFERTGSRSPMQWSGGVNAGFSCAAPDKLYIPIDPSPDRPCVEAQQDDPASLLNELRRLVALRMKYPQLQSQQPVELLSDTYPLAYLRGDMLIVINPSEKEASCGGSFIPLETVYSFGPEPELSNGRICAGPVSAAFIKIQRKEK